MSHARTPRLRAAPMTVPHVLLAGLLALSVLVLPGPAGPARGVELPGSLRDAFPVFNAPEVIAPDAAEARGVVGPRDFVIGIALGGAARAYPIAVMAVHELGNDTLGGVPIAVTW